MSDSVHELPSYRRPLRPSEQRLLRARTYSIGQAGGGNLYLFAAGAVFAVLWVLTLLASDVPWPWVTAFWAIVGGAIGLWVKRDLGRDRRAQKAILGSITSARRRDTAEVYDIRARAFAEFEEVEDEGACYAFQLQSDTLVFVAGQQFYPGARFPSLDFSLVHLLDGADRTVDVVIEKRGPRARPSKTIPRGTKWELDIPEHLEVRSGRLDTLEAILGREAV